MFCQIPRNASTPSRQKQEGENVFREVWKYIQKYYQRCGNPKKKKIRRWGEPLIQVGGKKCIGEQGRGGKCKKLKGSNSSLALLRAIFLLFGNRRQIFSTTRLSKLIPKLNMSFFLNISISERETYIFYFGKQTHCIILDHDVFVIFCIFR